MAITGKARPRDEEIDNDYDQRSRPFTTTAADEERLAATIVALEEHGFGVEVVEDPDAAGATVLACIRGRASVMTNTSVTLDETGTAHPINESGNYDCRPP